MIIKGSQAIEAGFTEDGLISLTQYSKELDEAFTIYLTKNQFDSIERWVFKNRNEIESNWNGGVCDA